MKIPVLIVVIASVVVLCTLPAIYIFLACHTHKERKRWKVAYDKQVKNIEAEEQRNPRPASTATYSIYYSTAQGRAPSAQHSYYHRHYQQPRALARPRPCPQPSGGAAKVPARTERVQKLTHPSVTGRRRPTRHTRGRRKESSHPRARLGDDDEKQRRQKEEQQ